MHSRWLRIRSISTGGGGFGVRSWSPNLKKLLSHPSVIFEVSLLVFFSGWRAHRSKVTKNFFHSVGDWRSQRKQHQGRRLRGSL